MKRCKKIGKGVSRCVSMLLMALILLNLADISTNREFVAQAATVKTKSYDMAVAETLNLSKKITGKSKKATYSFKSSKKSVATVNKSGVVTAKKAGTSKITITEKKNGESKELATVTVTVHKSSLIITDHWFVSGLKNYFKKNPLKLNVKDYVNYPNPKATYTWFTDNKSMLELTKKGVVVKTGNTYGISWVNLTIKETYKGKTKKVGSIKVKVECPQLYREGETIIVKKGSVYNVNGDLGDTANYYTLYVCNQYYKDNSHILETLRNNTEKVSAVDFKMVNGQWNGELLLKKKGTVYLYYVAYNYETGEFDIYMGYNKLVIK